VIPSTAGIFLSQKKYITDLMHKSGMTDTKPTSTPFSATDKLLKDSGDLLPSPTEYQALRYLAGSCDKGVFISTTAPLNLHAYSDADWVSDKDDYISTTGYLLYLGSTPISWSSRKQRSVARSST